MPSVPIRPATLADIPAITAIYGHSVTTATASFELEPPDAAEMRARMQGLLDGGFPYLAAEIDGRIAGYAYAALYRTRPAYRLTVEDSVYVAPDLQRRGIGQALLERLIAESTTRNYRQMVAVIGDSTQQQGSIAVHKAVGFELIGIMPAVGFKHGRWLDTVIMQRALGKGATTPP